MIAGLALLAKLRASPEEISSQTSMVSAMELDEEHFVTQAMRHLFKSRGIDLSGYSESFVMRSLRKRMGRSGARDYTSYLSLLLHSEDETNELLGALSINVTEFFRDKGAFECFTAKVIKPLLSIKRAEGGILRIWSAGCASGQEPYTIALCVAEELRRMSPEKRPMASVVGTDISEKALEKANRGTYTANEVKGVPDKLLADYFDKKGGHFEAGHELQRIVRFSRENLLDPPIQKFFDAVVCRNVMIYFSRRMHDVVTMHLYESLRRGGYMMLGKTETLIGAPRQSFEVVDLENRILRRI